MATNDYTVYTAVAMIYLITSGTQSPLCINCCLNTHICKHTCPRESLVILSLHLYGILFSGRVHHKSRNPKRTHFRPVVQAHNNISALYPYITPPPSHPRATIRRSVSPTKIPKSSCGRYILTHPWRRSGVRPPVSGTGYVGCVWWI